MKKTIKINLKKHFKTFENFIKDHFNIVIKICLLINKTLKKKGKICLISIGGKAADYQYFAEEMIVKYEKKRKALPFISFTNDTSIMTACANDFNFHDIFTRQLEALIKTHDILIAFFTSGKIKNIIKHIFCIHLICNLLDLNK